MGTGGTLYKCKLRYKGDEDKQDKVANTPINAYLVQGNISGMPIPDFIDRQWYIDLAYERLRQFGGE